MTMKILPGKQSDFFMQFTALGLSRFNVSHRESIAWIYKCHNYVSENNLDFAKTTNMIQKRLLPWFANTTTTIQKRFLPWFCRYHYNSNRLLSWLQNTITTSNLQMPPLQSKKDYNLDFANTTTTIQTYCYLDYTNATTTIPTDYYLNFANPPTTNEPDYILDFVQCHHF